MTRDDEASLAAALALAEEAAGRAYPNPTVGAVVVRAGEIVGWGVTEAHGGRHGEVVALAAAGERARGATLYVTLEPCAHHGRTPPCVDAVLAAGVRRVVAASLDPSPLAGGGLVRLREASLEVEEAEGELAQLARRQNEAWRRWVSERRPFVTLKLAVSVDGRVVVPGRRWVSGEASRHRVHELRARSDAVAVGMGTFRADSPRLDARGVEAQRQPRRLVFGSGPLPHDAGAELVREPIDEALTRLATEGVQSLLLEGGPKLAASFLAGGLVDKLLLFVAPVLAGAGARAFCPSPGRVGLHHLSVARVGEDVLLEGYLREP